MTALIFTMNIKTANEKELRDMKLPRIHSLWGVCKFIYTMSRRKHDYGTCVYAASMSAVVAFNYISHKLGMSGFQASMADMDILARTRNWKWGRILNFEDLLYPQYAEHFLSYEVLLEEQKVELAERAKKLLEEKYALAAPRVVAHWQMLADKVPDDITSNN